MVTHAVPFDLGTRRGRNAGNTGLRPRHLPLPGVSEPLEANSPLGPGRVPSAYNSHGCDPVSLRGLPGRWPSLGHTSEPQRDETIFCTARSPCWPESSDFLRPRLLSRGRGCVPVRE